MKKSWIAALLLAGLGTATFAHHAMEFIEMESYNTAPRGSFVFHLHYDYLIDDPDQPMLDHWEFTPGLSYGVNDRFMVDVHSHFAKFGARHLIHPAPVFSNLGPSPFMEAIAFSAQYRITQKAPLDIGLAITFEQPFPRSVDLLGGEQVLSASLTVSRTFGDHHTVLLNLNAEQEGAITGYGWALGLRTPLTPDTHGISAGLEILGDYEGAIAFLPGIYFPLGMQDIVFKTGLEFTPGTGTTRSNLTLLYQF